MKENSAPLIDYTFFFFNLYCHSVARRLARWQVWGVMRHVTGALEWTGVKCFIRGQNRMVRGETRILVSVTQGQEVALTPLPTHLDMNHWHSQWPKWIKKKKHYLITQNWMTYIFGWTIHTLLMSGCAHFEQSAIRLLLLISYTF